MLEHLVFCLYFSLPLAQTLVTVNIECSQQNKTGDKCVSSNIQESFYDQQVWNVIYFYYGDNHEEIYLSHNINMNITQKCFNLEFFLQGNKDRKKTSHQTWPWDNSSNQFKKMTIPSFESINKCQDINVLGFLTMNQCGNGEKVESDFIGFDFSNPLEKWLEAQATDNYFPKMEFGWNNIPTITWEGIPDFGCDSVISEPTMRINYTVHVDRGENEGSKILEETTSYTSLFETREYPKLELAEDDRCYDIFIKIQTGDLNRFALSYVFDERLEKVEVGKLTATISKSMFLTSFEVVREDKKDIICLNTIAIFSSWSMEDELNTHRKIQKLNIEKSHPKQAHIEIGYAIDKRCTEYFYTLTIPSLSQENRNDLEMSGRSFPEIMARKNNYGDFIILELKATTLNKENFKECANLRYRLECSLVNIGINHDNKMEVISNKNGIFHIEHHNLQKKDCLAFAHIADLNLFYFKRKSEIRILKGEVLLELINSTETPHQNETYSMESTSVAIGILIIIVLLNISLIIIFIKRKKKQENIINIEITKLRKEAGHEQPLPDWAVCYEQPRESLHVGQEIGRGSFGIVYRGKSDIGGETEVAIKTHAKKIEAKEDLLNEAELLAKLDYHYNIINLLGIAVEPPDKGNGLLLIMEICDGGCLLPRLKQRMMPTTKDEANNPQDEDTDELIGWTYQIAMGMGFLAQQNIIHGDLAARNILLDKDNNVKIGDFGKAHKLDYSNISVEVEGAQPIHWMAPEAVKEKEVTLESDKWSYGVTVWEIFSLGEHPYSNRPGSEGLQADLKKGYRLAKPDLCPAKIYEKIMMPCWDGNPDLRPGWEDVAEELSAMVNATYLQEYQVRRRRNKDNYHDIRNTEKTRSKFYTIL